MDLIKNYIEKANKLSTEEKEAVNKFITHTVIKLEDAVSRIYLFGPAAYTDKDRHIDLAVILNEEISKDPISSKNFSMDIDVVDCFAGVESSKFLERKRKNATIFEDQKEIDNVLIHYLLMPSIYGTDSEEFVRSYRSDCPGYVSSIFFSMLVDDGILLYEK